MNQHDNSNGNQSVLPRRSDRLATIIPAEHWISIGYSQDDAELMEILQDDMKRYADGDLLIYYFLEQEKKHSLIMK